MTVPIKSCCGRPLEWGVNGIGIIGIILMIITIIILSIFFTTQDDKLRDDTRKAVILGLIPASNQNEFAETSIKLAKTMWIIGICSSCTMIISSLLIIIGSHNETHKLLLPWLICCIIHYCVILAFYCVEVIAMNKDPTDTTTGGEVIISLQIIVCTSFTSGVENLANPQQYDKNDITEVFLNEGDTLIILTGCVNLIVGGLMFFAVYKSKYNLLVPYLILEALNIFGLIGMMLVIFISVLLGILSAAALFLEILIGVVLSLFVYMWIVVYSHYVVLKEENARGQYDKQAYRAT